MYKELGSELRQRRSEKDSTTLHAAESSPVSSAAAPAGALFLAASVTVLGLGASLTLLFSQNPVHGPLRPVNLQLLFVIDAFSSFAIVSQLLFLKNHNAASEVTRLIVQCELLRFFRLAATLVGPVQLGGLFVEYSSLQKISPVLALLLGLYDLIVVHEKAYLLALPTSWRFSPALGKAVLVLDVNRILAFCLFFEIDDELQIRKKWDFRGTVWLSWLCFVLASYVYSTYVMMRKRRCYSFSLAMFAGCIGLALGTHSHVAPMLSGKLCIMIYIIHS